MRAVRRVHSRRAASAHLSAGRIAGTRRWLCHAGTSGQVPAGCGAGGLREQGRSKKERKKELSYGCLTVITFSLCFYQGCGKTIVNFGLFCSVLLCEDKNLKLIPVRKAVPSFTLMSMISSDDFRFIVP